MINKKGKKCKLCKGRGMTQIAKDVKGIQICPACHGKGILDGSFTIKQLTNTEGIEFIEVGE